MNEQQHVFDRAQVRQQRRRAAADFGRHDFLFRELAERLLDRLADIRQSFPLAVDLSPQIGGLTAVWQAMGGNLGGIDTLIEAGEGVIAASAGGGALRVACTEEALPFRAGSLDLILSCMGLHWVNDLPGAFIQMRDALRPDGLFLGVMLGGETLTELRQCLMEAELAETGGASPRVSPMVGLRDAAGLLQRASFALPVADVETLTVTYPNALALMHELRGMGEGNALVSRSRKPLGRNVIARAASLYAERYGDAEGRIPVTFQALFLTGWAPSANQQQPARRGSGEISLANVFAAKDCSS